MRHVAGGAAAVLLLGLLVGCGDDAAAPAPQETLITALGDPTPSVSPTPVGEPSGSVATRSPKPKPTKTTTPKPSAPPTPDATAQSAQLFKIVSKAISAYDSVHVSTGAATGARALEADHRYGSDSNYNATLTLPGATAQLRRVGGVLYAQTNADAPWESIGPDDPRLAQADPALDQVRGLLAWDPVGDLGAVIRGATTLKLLEQGRVNGASVNQVRLDVDAVDLPASAALPAGLTGSVVVTLALDASTSLPVRCDYALPSGAIARADYRAWGAPVSVIKPPVDPPRGR